MKLVHLADLSNDQARRAMRHVQNGVVTVNREHQCHAGHFFTAPLLDTKSSMEMPLCPVCKAAGQENRAFWATAWYLTCTDEVAQNILNGTPSPTLIPVPDSARKGTVQS